MLQRLLTMLLGMLLICAGCGRSEQVQGSSEDSQPSTASAEAEESPLDIDVWSMQYYLDPDPDRVPRFLRELEEHGVLEREGSAEPMIGFLSHVMAANPERLSAWFPPDDRIFLDERAVYYRALWQADVPEAKAILDDVQERGPDELAARLREMRSTSPRPILERPVTSPGALDVLWGAFFASGDVRYIEAIISVVEGSASGYEEIVIQGAAAWSLRANARQHELVYRTCKDYVDEHGRQSSDDLKKIVESASEYWP